MKRKAVCLILFMLLFFSSCASKDVSTKDLTGEYDNNGFYVVKNSRGPENPIADSMGKSTDFFTPFENLDDFEEAFFIDESYNHLIVRGEKLSSTSYYKDDGYKKEESGNELRDISAYTLTEVKINEVIKQDNIEYTEKIEEGSVVTIIECYSYKEGEDGTPELLYPSYLSGPQVLLNDENEYLLFLRTTPELLEELKIDRTDLFDGAAFLLDDKSKSTNSNSSVLDEKIYGRHNYLYPELIDRYIKN